MDKNNYLRLLVLSVFLLVYGYGFSQDRIVRTYGDTLKVRILDIGSDKIKFKWFGAGKSDPVQEIYKNKVKEIIFENGAHLTIIYDSHYVSPDLMIPVRGHSIKVDFLSPALNHLTMGYEFNLRTGKSIEIKGGIIGPGLSSALKHSTGFLLKGGIKFIWLTSDIKKGLEYTPPLQGNYIKPELIFSNYTTDEEDEKVTYTNYAVSFNFGRQLVIDNSVIFDYYVGVGLGMQSSNTRKIKFYDENAVDFRYAYSHIFFGETLPIVICGGITFGFVY